MRRLLASLLLGWLIAYQATAATTVVGCASHGTGAGNNAANRKKWTTAKATAAPGDIFTWDEETTAASPVVLDATGCSVDTTGMNGTAGNEIQINNNPEGSVVIYGAGLRAPVRFNDNAYVHVTGFNFINIKDGPGTATTGCGAGGGICGVATFVGTAHHNTISRSTMCNAATNYNLHVVTYTATTNNNLIEDSFICGSGRKSVEQHGPSNTQANSNRIRRTYVIRGGSENAGPTPGISMTYTSRGFYLDNVFITPDRRPDIDIGTDPDDGAIQDGVYYEKNNSVRSSIQRLNWDIEGLPGSDDNYGLIGNDNIVTGLRDGRVRITGSLVFLPPGADYHQPRAFWSADQLIDYQINQSLAINRSTNVYPSVVGLRFPNCTAANCTPYITQSVSNFTYINASGVGTTNNAIGTNVVQTNVKTGSSIGAVYTGGGTPYLPNANQGGGICKQSIDGVIGSTNLFPLVMEARVNLEMIRQGKGPYSMTAKIEEAMGSPVPTGCGGAGGATPTNTPTFTATHTATNTLTPTNTRTNTPTFTFTRTNTPTNTHTPPPTVTPPGATNTPTPSFTPTHTLTPTVPPTNTPTPFPTQNPADLGTIIINLHRDYVSPYGWVYWSHGYAPSDPPPHYFDLGPVVTPLPTLTPTP